MYLFVKADADHLATDSPEFAIIDLEARRERIEQCLAAAIAPFTAMDPKPYTVTFLDYSPRWVQYADELESCDFYEELIENGSPVLVEALPDFLREDAPGAEEITTPNAATRIVIDPGSANNASSLFWESSIADTNVKISTDWITWRELSELTVYPGLMIENEDGPSL